MENTAEGEMFGGTNLKRRLRRLKGSREEKKRLARLGSSARTWVFALARGFSITTTWKKERKLRRRRQRSQGESSTPETRIIFYTLPLTRNRRGFRFGANTHTCIIAEENRGRFTRKPEKTSGDGVGSVRLVAHHVLTPAINVANGA